MRRPTPPHLLDRAVPTSPNSRVALYLMCLSEGTGTGRWAHLVMHWLSSWPRIWISCWMSSISSSALSRSMILMATGRVVRRSYPRNTSPNEPLPVKQNVSQSAPVTAYSAARGHHAAPAVWCKVVAWWVRTEPQPRDGSDWFLFGGSRRHTPLPNTTTLWVVATAARARAGMMDTYRYGSA